MHVYRRYRRYRRWMILSAHASRTCIAHSLPPTWHPPTSLALPSRSCLAAAWWTARCWQASRRRGAPMWKTPAACCCTCGSGGAAGCGSGVPPAAPPAAAPLVLLPPAAEAWPSGPTLVSSVRPLPCRCIDAVHLHTTNSTRRLSFLGSQNQISPALRAPTPCTSPAHEPFSVRRHSS